MSDERDRRYRAHIDLSNGRATVSELHPVDRRTAATIPGVRPPTARAEPPHPPTDVPIDVAAPPEASVSVPASPIFPWQRTPEATLPQPQDVSRRGQPLYGAPPQAEPEPTFDAGIVPPGDAASVQAPAEDLPWSEQRDPVAMPIYMDESALERIADTVVARLRSMLGLAPEEPPVPLMHAAEALQLDTMAEMNPAGSFVTEVESEPAFDPAGSFVHEP